MKRPAFVPRLPLLVRCHMGKLHRKKRRGAEDIAEAELLRTLRRRLKEWRRVKVRGKSARKARREVGRRWRWILLG